MHKTTVVSAWFPLKNAKQPIRKYHQWIENFMLLDCQKIVYTDDLEILHYNSSNTVIIITDRKILNIEEWASETAKDPERDIHTPALYAIWNAKTDFVRMAIAKNHWKTQYFLWCDIGAFRQRDDAQNRYKNVFPRQLPLIAGDKIALLQLRKFDPEDLVLDKNYLPPPYEKKIRIGGGIFGGSIRAWVRWDHAFRGMTARFREFGLCAAKDQAIMSAVVCVFPELVQLCHFNPSSPRDPWFAMQEVLSGL